MKFQQKTAEDRKNEILKKAAKARMKFQDEQRKTEVALDENQIRFEYCKTGYTYQIDARNFTWAIFYNDVFYGIRRKFNDTFIDAEIHWDKDDKHGTARPQVEIEKAPNDVIEALRYYLDINVNGDRTKDAFEIVRNYLIKFTKL